MGIIPWQPGEYEAPRIHPDTPMDSPSFGNLEIMISFINNYANECACVLAPWRTNCVCALTRTSLCVCALTRMSLCVRARLRKRACFCASTSVHVCLRERASLHIRVCSPACACVPARPRFRMRVCMCVCGHL